MAEFTGGLRTGSVLYYNGSSVRSVIDGVGVPIGIALDRQAR